ncbi:thyrotroph embryonic factor-like [Centruroides sculpturatus]|uniref:thyrotroph embryonic factor-like n=1 Tax=Centruroides sculpturatus TaxID=218467 RepID=UPI000C6D7929|nr:thyrotroph embryonic factor-like [Centruroides sculpturatus]
MPPYNQRMENAERRTVLVSPDSAGDSSNESSVSNEMVSKRNGYMPAFCISSPQYIIPVSINSQERYVQDSGVPANWLNKTPVDQLIKVPRTNQDENLAIVLSNKKKKPQPFPEECKDKLYWERRRRNNESAKKSRALRKIKEQQTSARVLRLEHENLQLKTEVSLLKQELERLQKLVYAKTTVES